MNLTAGDGKTVPMDGTEAERPFFRFLLRFLSFYLYRNNVMSGILVPFLKQIVGDFVYKTKVLDGLPLRHCLRFVTDEQMLKIAAAIHYYWIFDYSSKGRDFYSLGEDVIFGRLQDIYVIKMG